MGAFLRLRAGLNDMTLSMTGASGFHATERGTNRVVEQILDSWLRYRPTGSDRVAWIDVCSRSVGTHSWVPVQQADVIPVEVRGVPELLETVRRAFGLSIAGLARVMAVERPTIYAWLRGPQSIRAENESRLMTVAALADEWLKKTRQLDEGSEISHHAPSAQIIDLLSSTDPDYAGVQLLIGVEASAQISEYQRSARSFKARVRKGSPRSDQSSFDLETRRPLGPIADR